MDYRRYFCRSGAYLVVAHAVTEQPSRLRGHGVGCGRPRDERRADELARPGIVVFPAEYVIHVFIVFRMATENAVVDPSLRL